MVVDQPRIRVKAMIIILNETATHHAVSVNDPTPENRLGYHRLVGGSVQFGETTREAIKREVQEELDAEIHGLDYLGVLENVFRLNGETGHELVAVFIGRLDPEPPTTGGTLTESDGTVAPVAWRRIEDDDELIPLYPAGVNEWARRNALPSQPSR